MGWFFKKKEEPRVEETPSNEWFSVKAHGYKMRVFSSNEKIPGDVDNNPRHTKDNLGKIVIFGDYLKKSRLSSKEKDLVMTLADDGYYYFKSGDFLTKYSDGNKYDLFVSFHDFETEFSFVPREDGDNPVGIVYVSSKKIEESKMIEREIYKTLRDEITDYNAYLNRTNWCITISDPDGDVVWMSRLVEIWDDQNGKRGGFEEYDAIEDAVEDGAGTGKQPDWEIVEDLLDAAWDEVSKEIDEADEEEEEQ